MRIGIDARLLKIRRGIGNYVRSLLREYALSDTAHTFFLYLDDRVALADVPDDPRFITRLIAQTNYAVWEQLIFPKVSRLDHLDVIHFPGNTAPWLPTHIPSVLTLHDTIFFHQRSLQNLYYRLTAPPAARHARLVITVSEFSKRDILANIPRLTTPIRVIHSGPGSAGDNIRDGRRRPAQAAATGRPFALALGARDPRKNMDVVLRAFAILARRGTPPLDLVIAGLDDKTMERVELLTTEAGIRDWVRLLPFVDDAALSDLYADAVLFVFPSLYEGFGFPLLEAMSRGTPVVAAERTATPEIAGEAALYFDGYDDVALAERISRLMTSSDLRIKLAGQGRTRAATFSWRAAAQATLEAYQLVPHSSHGNGCR